MEAKPVGPTYCCFCGSEELNSQRRCKTFRCPNMRTLNELSEEERLKHEHMELTATALEMGRQMFSR
jgi:hypothetical protein